MKETVDQTKRAEATSSSMIIDETAQMRQLVLDSSPLAIMVFDHRNVCIDCNEAALKLFEVPDKKEFLENHFLYSAPIQPNGMFAGDYGRVLAQTAMVAGENTAEWVYRTKSGELIQSEITLKRIEYDGARIIIIYVRDMRAEIDAQAEVIEITERNKIMIDVTPICFVFFDDNFNVVDCNSAALTLFGVPSARAFAEKFFTLSPERQSDGEPSYESYIANMQKAFNDGRLVFEWDHLTAAGESLPVEVVFVRVEYRRSYRIAGYFRDLREHRQMLQEMHKLRTPVNEIIGLTNLATKNEMSDTLKKDLEKIEQSAKSLIRTIDDILGISKME